MRDSVWARSLPAGSRQALEASDPLPKTADVVVVGAGMVGLCVALSLCRRQAGRVVVLDRSSVCSEASGASAGGVWPALESRLLGTDVARRASALQVRLRNEFACDYMPGGLIRLVLPENADAARQRLIEPAREAGFSAEMVSGQELSEREPHLRHGGPAVHFPGDGSLHPLKLAAGIAGWLHSQGVRICLNEGVERIGPGPAVVARSGTVSAAAIVIAAGAWTPLLTKLLGWEPPIRPLRGTLLATGPLPDRLLRSVVVGSQFYYWQAGHGAVAGGGSLEDVGFRDEFDESVADRIRSDFQALFPVLGNLSFDCGWNGFRPYCGDDRPVVGRIPGREQVYVAAGHFRWGILLGPLSAELVAGELLNGSRPDWADGFRPERFPARPVPG